MTHLSTHLRGNPSSQDKVHIYMYTVEITTSFHITLFVYRGVACKTKLIEKEKYTIGPFIRGKIRRELYHLYEHVLSNKTRLS